MQFGLLFRIIRQRLLLILAITAVTVASAAVASFLMEKIYTASATLFVDVKSTDPVTGEGVFTPQNVQNILNTQVSVITSSRVANEVVDGLGLLDDPKVMADWKENGGIGGRENLRADITEELLKEIKVEASRDGTTITIEYESTNPEYAAQVVNSFSDAYIKNALSLATDPAREYAREFEKQTETYRLALEAAQARLAAFQQESGIVASDETVDVENQRLSALAAELVRQETQAADSQSRVRTARGNGRSAMPEVVQNPLIQTLQADVGRAAAEVRDLGSRLGSNHPQYISANETLTALQERLNTEIGRISRSLTASNAVNQRNLARLRQQVDQQREKVLALKGARNQIAALQREVDSEQQAYDLVRNRFTQTDLESKARQSNVSVITAATVPTEPSRPLPKLNIAVGAFLGLLIGTIAALTIEATQRPLRNAEDLLQAVGVPVLAVVPPAKTRRAQRLVGPTGPAAPPAGLQLGHRS
ncbi:MAG: Wzz/FepE/Etk N-terminal domain-containing protein [Burkholderiaceae bacterium]